MSVDLKPRLEAVLPDETEVFVTRTASDTLTAVYVLNETGTLRIFDLGWWSERDGEGAVHAEDDDEIEYPTDLDIWVSAITALAERLA